MWFCFVGRNRKKPLLDNLLSAEKAGMIDSQGVGEEVDHIIAAVSMIHKITWIK